MTKATSDRQQATTKKTKTPSQNSSISQNRIYGFKIFVADFNKLPVWARVLFVIEVCIFNLFLLLLLGLVVGK